MTNQNTIDPKTTAILIVDPQNDFLSEGGAVWDLVGGEVTKNRVVERLERIKQAAKDALQGTKENANDC